ncbi:C4-dicarboxylate ABC transporter [Burkholderia sp. SG-MS1]|uniref:TRAP transporter large permease n=1 Tax=Paraburkholderia sp. SG-MS1 TaxID=2023741 RepID=UPI0014466987|nr:TRAP transporter large permease [Paraburkholderia sp. SG-MS1]NKJ48528.1 C4-dicarboxylate ABC transporter [Paraburkholderia sp. SG-MS1]
MMAHLQIAITFVLFLGLLGAGMAVPFAILVPALVYLFMQGGVAAFSGIGLTSWGSMDSYTLTAIPLFILMAECIQASGLGFRVYGGLARLFRRMPGGLIQTNIIGCALFAAVSGSSIATAAAVGNVALPQLGARNYDRKLSTGSLAAGGTLGILFPPSIALIVYGTFTETSVAKLFMAGVAPGVLLTLMFMLYVGIRTMVRPDLVEQQERGSQRIAWVVRALCDVLPLGILIGGVLGAIYAGIATPTEAAAVGCIAAVVICRLFATFTLHTFFASLKRSTLIVGNIIFITYSAFIFSYAMSYAGVGEEITSFIVGLHLTKPEFFLALLILYTALGALIESLGMIVITVPLLAPVLSGYGIDPIWFGIVVVMFIEMGQITPPIGINLFVIQSISKGSITEVVQGTIPFHLIMFILLALLMMFPQIALWLPTRMIG